jgi:hypothetical protein
MVVRRLDAIGRGGVRLSVVQLSSFEPRASEALERIRLAADSLTALLADSDAIKGAVINGVPQLVRDLEFLANELETYELLARSRLIMAPARQSSR